MRSDNAAPLGWQVYKAIGQSGYIAAIEALVGNGARLNVSRRERIGLHKGWRGLINRLGFVQSLEYQGLCNSGNSTILRSRAQVSDCFSTQKTIRRCFRIQNRCLSEIAT